MLRYIETQNFKKKAKKERKKKKKEKDNRNNYNNKSFVPAADYKFGRPDSSCLSQNLMCLHDSQNSSSELNLFQASCFIKKLGLIRKWKGFVIDQQLYLQYNRFSHN